MTESHPKGGIIMGLFQKKNTTDISPRQALENKYNISRSNLLAVIVFTLINILMAAFGSTSYFLFSASIPYYLVFLGSLMCGKFPIEDDEGAMTEADFLDSSFLIVMIVIAIIMTAFYGLFYFLSRKQKSGWLIVALVFFVIDTIGMFYLWGFSIDMILDLLFHIWVIYYLVSGIIAANKLKNLPEEEPAPVTVDPLTDDFPAAEVTEEQPKNNDSDFNY